MGGGGGGWLGERGWSTPIPSAEFPRCNNPEQRASSDIPNGQARLGIRIASVEWIMRAVCPNCQHQRDHPDRSAATGTLGAIRKPSIASRKISGDCNWGTLAHPTI